ncbi:MAG: PilW family protein [Cocleimonas sp.]
MTLIKTTSLVLRRNQGLSLIELLISMTLGLSLIGGLMSMYLGSRASDKTRTELADIEANARVAFSSLRQVIEHAGYRSSAILGTLDKPFQTTADGSIDNPDCRDDDEMIVSGLGTLSGILNPPTELVGYTKDADSGDSITVIYRADNPVTGGIFTDCAFGDYATATSTTAENEARQLSCSVDQTSGIPTAADAKIYSGYYLKPVAGKLKQLVCYGSRKTDAAPQIIAENIDNMQILYGIRVDGKLTYKNATSLEANNEWESVVIVQLALLVGSENEKVLENSQDRTYQLLDKTVSKTENDRRMYKVYTTSINLPNRSRRGFK